MAYVFGTTFVCDGMDNAKKVKKMNTSNKQSKPSQHEKWNQSNKQMTIVYKEFRNLPAFFDAAC